MGFDYYRKSPPPGPSWRDREAYDAWEAEHHTYLRRNIYGASRLADAVIDLGMGFDTFEYVDRLAPFPKAEDYDVKYEFDEDAGRGSYVGERVAEYEAALEAHLRWHGPEIPGIPAHKLCYSNDGWWVTREECQAALGLYERAMAAGESHPEAFYDDFIPFLRASAAGDGFTSH